MSIPGDRRSTLAVAAALALASAVSLGLARFAYALLLPPMRADLGRSYLTAGAMNTANAAGYLLGALLLPRTLARVDARRVLLVGSAGTALLLATHGLVRSDAVLLVLRLLSGAASAAAFVTGGLLAARLAGTGAPSSAQAGPSATPAPGQTAGASAGLVLGIYYGGTGVGIVAASLLAPPLAARAVPQAWQGAWLALAALALLATGITASMTRSLHAPPQTAAPPLPFAPRPFAWALGGYLMFGLGYIGYMTFVITLLREQGLLQSTVIAFYVLLGQGVVASSWLWAGLLQRHRGGRPMAALNGLLALATAMLVASAHPVLVFASGALFGAVFLSVVASTTALVRHNLPAAAWSGGITAFTIVFACGQIVGPVAVGWVADGPGGLVRGFAVSAGLLGLGALLAARQRPLQPARG